MQNDRRRISLAASSAFPSRSRWLFDTRIVGGILIATATADCARKEVAEGVFANRDPHSAAQRDRPSNGVNPAVVACSKRAQTVERPRDRCRRNLLQNNVLWLLSDSVPARAKRSSPLDVVLQS
jgi:hypothetical protein